MFPGSDTTARILSEQGGGSMSRERRPVASVTRVIAGRPREVFKAWTNPSHPATPWSKRNGIRRAIVVPAIGSLFYINMGPPMPLATHFGRFVRLDSPKRIEHTWA